MTRKSNKLMSVILLEKVNKLGKFGDEVKVKGGFGRNFLIPQQKALMLTPANKEIFDNMKASIEASNKEKIAAAETLKAKVENKEIIIARQAGDDGKLFGSVSTKDIADTLVKTANVENISRSSIILINPIKYVGLFEVTVSLHPEVTTTITVIVARSESEGLELKKNEAAKKSADNKKAKEKSQKETDEAVEEKEEVVVEKE